MSNVYFTSDTHYGHSNIASKNISKWKDGYRYYDSLDDMNSDLVASINRTVKADDTLYHLGDWSFGGIDNIWKFRKQINCQNIHLILGNHDHHIEENKILPNVHTGYNLIDTQGKYVFVDGPKTPTENVDVFAKDLFSSVAHYKEVSLNGRIFVLSHYGFRVWHGSHKGWIHLYAHSHDSLPPYGKSRDVGVDVALRLFNSPRPFRVSEIIEYIDKQPLEFPDHHDLSTSTGKPGFARKRN